MWWWIGNCGHAPEGTVPPERRGGSRSRNPGGARRSSGWSVEHEGSCFSEVRDGDEGLVRPTLTPAVIDKDASDSGAVACSHVPPAVPDHPGPVEVEIEVGGGVEQEAGLLGLRHSQASTSSCGHTGTLVHSGGAGDPRVDGGQFRRIDSSPGDLRLVRYHHEHIAAPASAAHASGNAGKQLHLVEVGGAYGRPSRTIARLSTPSRSRKTAGSAMPGVELLDHRVDRSLEGLPGELRAGPAERADP